MKHVNVTPWVRGRKPSSPARPKASHPVGSQTEVRSSKDDVRSRGKARTQAASLNPEKCIVVDNRISPGNRTQSRRCAPFGRQQSWLRNGKRAGHHRGLRAGHVCKRVIRELGRASRFLGSNSRMAGDRLNQHPGVWGPTRPADEPSPARAGRNTKSNASTQGTGREPQANRPGRTKAVVAAHSTAGQGATHVWTRGEPRPKGPTIQAARQREGNAGHDVCARERQPGLRAQKLSVRNWCGLQKNQNAGISVLMGSNSHAPCGLVNCKVLGPSGPLLTNRMTELVTYGSVGGVGGNPGPYPAACWCTVKMVAANPPWPWPFGISSPLIAHCHVPLIHTSTPSLVRLLSHPASRR